MPPNPSLAHEHVDGGPGDGHLRAVGVRERDSISAGIGRGKVKEAPTPERPREGAKPRAGAEGGEGESAASVRGLTSLGVPGPHLPCCASTPCSWTACQRATRKARFTQRGKARGSHQPPSTLVTNGRPLRRLPPPEHTPPQMRSLAPPAAPRPSRPHHEGYVLVGRYHGRARQHLGCGEWGVGAREGRGGR
jgi:hypothetical protein